MFGDPGTLKSTMQPHDAVRGQYEMNVPEEFKEELKQVKYAPRFCNFCANWKAPRSHHCRRCKKCIIRMDHHCPFLFNCIGIRNHGNFLLMHTFAFIGMIHILILCAYVFFAMPANPGNDLWDKIKMRDLPHMQHFAFGPVAFLFTHIVTAVILKAGYLAAASTVISLVCVIAISICGLPSLYLATKNATLLEYQFGNQSEYAEIGENVYCPLGSLFYTMPVKLNSWGGLLGKHWKSRLFLPVNYEIDLNVGLNPVASVYGCEQLVQRIEQVENKGVELSVTSLDSLVETPAGENKSDVAI